MKIDEKCAQTLVDNFFKSYLNRLKEEGLINRFEIIVVGDTPIIIVTCYFDYKEDPFKKRTPRNIRKELYAKVILSTQKNFDFDTKYSFVEDDPGFDWFRLKVIKKIKERSCGESAENRAISLMQELKSEGRCGIVHVYKSGEYSDNNLKLDVILVIEKKMPKVFFDERNERFTIGFNVKSSIEGQKNHIEKNKHIPSLCLDKNLSDEEIKKNAKELIIHSLIYLHTKFTGSLLDKMPEYNFSDSLKFILTKSKQKIHK
ncbi:MAG: hypothetical protein NTX85_01520 [Candidatus Nomurabacteria bacterium]|nr:hypothetical protein [Candidatus Nomurabacteria bacterium]